MVSTRCFRSKLMGAILGRNLEDILPIMDAYTKGQNITNVYIDGGSQICVMSKGMMHCLGLEVDNPALCKAKMANNKKVYYV